MVGFQKGVECICKVKSCSTYEICLMVGATTSHNCNLILGAKVFPCYYYDGRSMNKQVEQPSNLRQEFRVYTEIIYADLSKWILNQNTEVNNFKLLGRSKSLTQDEKNHLKQRYSVEPTIWNLKADHRINRCHLKEGISHNLNVVLYMVANKIKMVLRIIVIREMNLLLWIHLQVKKTVFSAFVRGFRENLETLSLKIYANLRPYKFRVN